jgi:alcohol dehydrogenase
VPLFELKTKLYFGKGERNRLFEHLSEHAFTKCGIVIDKALLSHEVFKELITRLEKELKYFKLLTYDYNSEPTYGYLDTVKNFFEQGEVECLVGVGGGSAIDVTKALAVLIRNPVKKAVNLRGFPKISNLPVPVVAIPTISGTGTEVTYNAVFIDEVEKRKLGINTKFNFPIFSLLDPELTLTAPARQSTSSALDCLVHSLESFMSKKATFITRLLSIEAFYYAFSGIQGLLRNSGDIDAREQLMKASYLAGIALMNSSAGPAGALSYPLGSLFGVPHGLAGAFFLRHVLNYNLSNGYDDFYLLYERVNIQDSTSREEKAKDIVRAITKIIDEASVPRQLSEFGVKKENIPNFTQGILQTLEMNPVAMSGDEVNTFLAGVL